MGTESSLFGLTKWRLPSSLDLKIGRKIGRKIGLTMGLVMLGSLSNANQTIEHTFTSPSTQAQLVELYTSEGCSSCPPADTWLSKYRDSEALWQSVVPIAYHVDYWDYLGWNDPFAIAAHSSRQRQTARRADSGVYTPGVFRNQEEWRSWRRPNSWKASATPTGKAVGILAGKLSAEQLQVSFTPTKDLTLAGAHVEVVALRSGQTTKVKAGENRGRVLEHNFVAGPIQRTALVKSNGVWSGQLKTELTTDSSALAFWVVDSRGNYLQATGGWLDERS